MVGKERGLILMHAEQLLGSRVQLVAVQIFWTTDQTEKRATHTQIEKSCKTQTS